ncbi:MAG: TIGR03000 domain-containing protein [Pirellulales bacterium]|nr:TIGR03000 domain-containing protein [Pirellulales bacterium]
MLRSSRKFVVVGAVMAAVCLVATAQAEACWGYGCYQPVSYYTPCYTSWCAPCYTSCYTPCYTSCYASCDPCCGSWYLGCRPGPIRRALLGPYRWYYAGGCCYDACCWTSCCGTCCDPCVSSCCGAVTDEPAADQNPTVAPPQDKTPVDAAPMMDTTTPADTTLPTTGLPTRQNSGLLTIWVPGHAKVFINGKETTTQGSHRRYVSYGLQPGLTYKYEVRAEIVRNGHVAEETKTIYLTAGASEGLAFGFNREPINQVAAQ